MQHLRLQIFSPAKLNLSLKVSAKLRADGYHEIDSLMQMIDLGDSLQLTVSPGSGESLELRFLAPCQSLLAQQGEITHLESELKSENNLLLRAQRLWSERFLPSTARYAWHWHLAKATPTGAGLGGGSSNAAAALKILGRWAVAEGLLSPETIHSASYQAELMQIAAELGSDIPFFLLESTCARATGRGTELSPRRPEAAQYLLIFPRESAATAGAYARLDAYRQTLPEALWHSTANDFSILYKKERKEISEAFAAYAQYPLELTGSGSAFYFCWPQVQEVKRLERGGYLAWPARALLEVPQPVML